jgi:hypothetical protein
VTDVPGLTPRSPLTTVGPVFVTVLLPSTAKSTAVPSGGLLAASLVVGNAIKEKSSVYVKLRPYFMMDSPGTYARRL